MTDDEIGWLLTGGGLLAVWATLHILIRAWRPRRADRWYEPDTEEWLGEDDGE